MSLLENVKNDLLAQNDYLRDMYQNNPSIEMMEEQLSILENIKEEAGINFIDDKPFHEIGLLRSNDSFEDIPKRIKALLKLLDKQNGSSLIGTIQTLQYRSSTMKEAALRRRYKILKQTTEGSIKKTMIEKENLKNEIKALKEKLNNEKNTGQSFVSMKSPHITRRNTTIRQY